MFYDRGLPTIAQLAQATDFSVDEAGHEPGLHADYFTNDTLTGSPAFSRTETHVSFGRSSPGYDQGGLPVMLPPLSDNAQSERFTGYFTAKTSGAYIVAVQNTGEDGGYFRLTIDGTTVFDQWTEARALQPWTSLQLTAAPHTVVLEHRGRSQFLGNSLQLAMAPADSLVRPETVALAAKASAVVLSVGFDPDSESEASDRTFQLPFGQDELIRRVLAANPRTTIVLTSGGGVNMRPWIDQASALLETWYAGEEGGTALADILFGAVNPSGRLPATFDRRWEDNPAHDSYDEDPATKEVVYKAGVFTGYRGYERSGLQPLFPFGYGLSYSTFAYRGLAVVPRAGNTAASPAFDVTFNVRNTSSLTGADVAQVYVGPPANSPVPRPTRELKGFARVVLKPGQQKTVTITLDARAFAYYDVTGHRWVVAPGTYTVSVGRSVEDQVLTTPVGVGG